MRTGDIESYVNSLKNLTSIEIKIEEDEEVVGFRVVKTKETYVFEDEDEALAKVDAVRQDVGFVGVDKKFKQGKVNRAGEEIRPDTWVVVAKLNK